MSWQDRLSRMDPRERRLLTAFFGVLAAIVLIVVPIVTQRAVLLRQGENEQLRKVIDELSESHQTLLKADAQRQSIVARYMHASPPLSAFLDSQARQNGFEVPEIQDRPVVPHGKRFEERSTRMQLRKVDLGSLARFMESVERAQYPIVFTRLDIRKRLSETNSYDVEIIASAYDRKEAAKSDANSSSTGSTVASGTASSTQKVDLP